MLRPLVAVVIFLVSITVYSQDSTSMHCSVAGYFEGQQEPFYSDLARGAIARDGLWKTTACKEDFEKGRTAAQFYQEHREPKNEEDRSIAQQAVIFKAKVRLFILDGAGI